MEDTQGLAGLRVIDSDGDVWTYDADDQLFTFDGCAYSLAELSTEFGPLRIEQVEQVANASEAAPKMRLPNYVTDIDGDKWKVLLVFDPSDSVDDEPEVECKVVVSGRYLYLHRPQTNMCFDGLPSAVPDPNS